MKAILQKLVLIQMVQNSTSEFHPAARFLVYLILTTILFCSVLLSVAVVQDGAPNLPLGN